MGAVDRRVAFVGEQSVLVTRPLRKVEHLDLDLISSYQLRFFNDATTHDTNTGRKKIFLETKHHKMQSQICTQYIFMSLAYFFGFFIGERHKFRMH